ncbi:MAG: hypothetical protein JSV67_07405 [Thermoplasmatales archaeon]|jgi:hypothetical protein|nr:MAG: hypothetical protein JSV67_07405 [Thermoplasmatales archaeon]
MKKSSLRIGGVILSYTLKIIMIVFLIISIWKLHWIWIFGCSLTLIVSFVPTILKRNYQITLPLVLEILIIIALILHVGGGLLGAYGISHYDTLTHFVSSFLVAFLAFVIIYILDEYWDGLMMDKYAMAFVVIIATIAMGVIWELNEWITDIIFGTHEQWGYTDTLKDLFIDALAGFVMAVIGVTMIKRGSFDDMTEEFGEQIDKIIKKSEKG